MEQAQGECIRCDRTTASVLARSANDAANLEMGLANDAARLRTASVRQDQRKCLRTASVRQDQRKYCVLVLRTHPVGSVVRITAEGRNKKTITFSYSGITRNRVKHKGSY